MLGELENKIHEYYNDISNKELQKEVIYAALKEMAVICVSGLNVYVHNKAYMNNLIGQDLINDDTARHIKELLIDDCNMEEYEKYVFKKCADMERVYSKYFDSYTSVLADGRIYNTILNMYWNEDAGVWQSDGSDGWVKFTLKMPYKASKEETEMRRYIGGTHYEKAYA